MQETVMVRDEEEEFWDKFDIIGTVAFILHSRFQRVALQFPDELLRHSVAVTVALKKELARQSDSRDPAEAEILPVRFFVMADTTFGSCCADEVAAMHADAQCIVHYGHSCLSVTSRLPVWFVFGRARLDVGDCATLIIEFAADNLKPLLVMFGLEYTYAVPNIWKKIDAIGAKELDISFAGIPNQHMNPSLASTKCETRFQEITPSSATKEQDMTHEEVGAGAVIEEQRSVGDCNGRIHIDTGETSCNTTDSSIVKGASAKKSSPADAVSEHCLGGLKWTIPRDRSMADYNILWIGNDGPGLINTSLIFNTSTVVRYDPTEKKLLSDLANQSKLLKRRYYLVERAKDANVVGIVVGTLGVAGYGEVIQNIRKMIEGAGKKAYTLVMGKPTPSKLANFPECDVFVLVACPQTALLDSRDYLAPLITPFEAELAFIEGKQWTGAYRLDFVNEPLPSMVNAHESPRDEARFSFLTGSYAGINPSKHQDSDDVTSRAIVLSQYAEHALQLQMGNSSSLITTQRSLLDIKSGAEYLASRTYQGLGINKHSDDGPTKPSQAIQGQKGRAAGYANEASS